MESTSENISKFVEHFSQHITNVSTLNSNYKNKLYNKALYFSIIDGMSSFVQIKHNRKKFLSIIRNYSEWTDHDKISLPHLMRLIELTKQIKKFEKLYNYCKNEIKNWIDGDIITLDRDLSVEDIILLLPSKDFNEKIHPKITLEYLQHANLAYTYRNSLVHELRHPGHINEGGGLREPFYMSLTHLDHKSHPLDTWELIYPEKFLKKLCIDILRNVETELRKKHIDPISFYSFGTYWLSELNNE